MAIPIGARITSAIVIKPKPMTARNAGMKVSTTGLVG